MELMKKLEQNFVFKAFLKLQSFLLIVCNLGSAFIVVFNVFMRYVLRVDFFGMDEVLLILMIWMYCIGGAYGSYEGSHITADILGSYIKDEKKLKILKVIQNLVSILVLVIMTFYVWKYLSWSFQKGGRSTALKYPLIIPQLSLGIGFTLMLIFHGIHFIDAIFSLFHKGSEQEVE